MKAAIGAAVSALLVAPAQEIAPRQMEVLGRGAVAIRQACQTVEHDAVSPSQRLHMIT
jgi:hypothetical protein